MNVSCILTTVQPSIECSASRGGSSLNFLTAFLCFQTGEPHAQTGASFKQGGGVSGGVWLELFLGRVGGGVVVQFCCCVFVSGCKCVSRSINAKLRKKIIFIF